MIGRFIIVYIDDVLIFLKTEAEHRLHVFLALIRLKSAGLKIRLKKCEFCKDSVTYLGYTISKFGISASLEKVKAIDAFITPKTVKELYQFLGMTGYYRSLIKNYSTIAVPLYELIKKGVKFVWSNNCQAAFEALKVALKSDEVMIMPNFEKPSILSTDASDEGMGAVIEQEDENGVVKVAAYLSQKFNKVQKNLSTYEKELYAITKSMEHFNEYL
jgi:hypothetical protein